jgi:hypothetical protein
MKTVTRTTSPEAAFSAEDAKRAESEGWNLFNEETNPEIQRDDEAGIFSTDDEALAFVRASDSPHASKALALVAAFKSRV